MGGPRNRIYAVLLAVACPMPLPGQPTGPKPKIDIMGSSVSAGYVDQRLPESGVPNETVPLVRVLRHIWPRDVATLRNRADLAMFMNPQERGERQVLRTLRSQPDLVVALDFLFWFGYGFASPDREGHQERLELQARGLELLSRLSCPIILGDYPDMSGADARILSPRMIPEPETLRELNRRLRAWAEDRPNVHIFPLAQWVKQLKEEGLPLPLEKGPLPTPPLYLLQSDKLHATRLGAVLMGYQLQEFCQQALPDGHPLRQDPVPLDTLIEALGAQPDLEGLKKVPAAAG